MNCGYVLVTSRLRKKILKRNQFLLELQGKIELVTLVTSFKDIPRFQVAAKIFVCDTVEVAC